MFFHLDLLFLPRSRGSAAEVRHVVLLLPGSRHWNGRRSAAVGKVLDLHGLHQDPLDDRQVPGDDNDMNFYFLAILQGDSRRLHLSHVGIRIKNTLHVIMMMQVNWKWSLTLTNLGWYCSTRPLHMFGPRYSLRKDTACSPAALASPLSLSHA